MANQIATYAVKETPIRVDKVVGTSVVDGTTKNFELGTIRQVYYPEDYGAVGDGSVDDTTPLNTCATAATGKVMALQPGKIYIYSGEIAIPANTIIEGNGATLKRRAGTALNSTTLTEIAAEAPNGTTVQVSDPSKFAVNMHVSFDDGTPNTSNGDPVDFSKLTHKITLIAGDVLTLATGFEAGITFAVGTVIRMSTGGLTLGAGCKVRNLVCDGNRANNLIGAAAWGWWVHHFEIKTAANCIIEKCEIKNAQAEGVSVSGDANIVRDCYFHDCAGNGIHLSGTTGTRIYGNRFDNNNLLMGPGTLLTTNTIHNEGHITFSDTIYKTVIFGNQFEDTNNYGIGSVGTNTANVVISSNQFTACVLGPVQIQATGSRITFADNQVEDCGTWNIDAGNALDIDFLTIANNQFDNTALVLDYVDHPVVIGNIFDCPLIASPLVLTNCSSDAVNEHNIVIGT
jgi:parallel beta-helix repeat protein